MQAVMTWGGQPEEEGRKKGEMTTMVRIFFRLMLLALLLSTLSGCWFVVAAGAGAAIGYYASQSGYKVQAPVTYKTPGEQQR
jgi:hypothetical protein